MADLIKLSYYSPLTSLSSSLNYSGQRAISISPNQCLITRVIYVSHFSPIARKQFKIDWSSSSSMEHGVLLAELYFPRTAQEHPDILFLKVNFDENKPMCKSLNVRVLPYFHFYRGADGLIESFSCSLAKFQKIKEAIELHNTARCSIGPPKGVGDLNLESHSPSKE